MPKLPRATTVMLYNPALPMHKCLQGENQTWFLYERQQDAKLHQNIFLNVLFMISTYVIELHEIPISTLV